MDTGMQAKTFSGDIIFFSEGIYKISDGLVDHMVWKQRSLRPVIFNVNTFPDMIENASADSKRETELREGNDGEITHSAFYESYRVAMKIAELGEALLRYTLVLALRRYGVREASDIVIFVDHPRDPLSYVAPRGLMSRRAFKGNRGLAIPGGYTPARHRRLCG